MGKPKRTISPHQLLFKKRFQIIESLRPVANGCEAIPSSTHLRPAEAMGFQFRSVPWLASGGFNMFQHVSTCFNSFQSQFLPIFRVFPKMGDPWWSPVVTIGFKCLTQRDLSLWDDLGPLFGIILRQHTLDTLSSCRMVNMCCTATWNKVYADPWWQWLTRMTSWLVVEPYPSENYESAGMMTCPIYNQHNLWIQCCPTFEPPLLDASCEVLQYQHCYKGLQVRASHQIHLSRCAKWLHHRLLVSSSQKRTTGPASARNDSSNLIWLSHRKMRTSTGIYQAHSWLRPQAKPFPSRWVDDSWWFPYMGVPQKWMLLRMI